MNEDKSMMGVNGHDIDVSALLHIIRDVWRQFRMRTHPLQHVVVLEAADDKERLAELVAKQLFQNIEGLKCNSSSKDGSVEA